MRRAIGRCCLFASGAAGLVYQVLGARQLWLTWGHDLRRCHGAGNVHALGSAHELLRGGSPFRHATSTSRRRWS